MTLEIRTPLCIDPGFGYENGDGYVRVWDKPKTEGGKLVMRHRWFWETFVSEIPDGYEVDHLCKNRRCCNLDHLQMLKRSEHRSKDNGERYKGRFARFKYYYLSKKPQISQKALAHDWGVTQSCICGWIKKINKEESKLYGVKR